MHLMSVLFPAPFVPRRDTACPFSTRKLAESTAFSFPKLLVTFLISINSGSRSPFHDIYVKNQGKHHHGERQEKQPRLELPSARPEFGRYPRADSRIVVRKLGIGLDHGKRQGRELYRLRYRAEHENPELGLRVYKALEEALGRVGYLTYPVPVLVVPYVIAPVIPAPAARPFVPRQLSPSPDLHLLVVVHEAVLMERVPSYGRHERNAYVVERYHVVAYLVPRIDQVGRVVEKDTDAVVHDKVVPRYHVVEVLEPYAVSRADAPVIYEPVPVELYIHAVHEEPAYVVVPEYVVFEFVMIARHVMEPVSAFLDDVPLDERIARPPDYEVPDYRYIVVDYFSPGAVPEAYAVPPLGHLDVLPPYRVAADDGMGRVFDVYAEQHVRQAGPFDERPPARIQQHPGILVREARTRPRHGKPPEYGARGFYLDYRP